MDIKSLLELVHELLDNASIDHALIGGLALGALGFERFTNDIDILVDGDDRETLKNVFEKAGFTVFNENKEFIQFAGKGPIDVMFANRPLSKEMLKHASKIKHIGIKCLLVEDIIGLKIQSFATNPKRELQEKADIQKLIELHDNNINWEKVKKYADIFSKWEDIQFIRRLIRK
ncbi:MAG: hypothetical protein A3F16_06930 [Deltaproteobacteria bacterium RIFCSPHIGHO2_12_FULL_43_9]|nr:MAG: hypothetical protein A3F16_06930 [Deltaproteobacteria bacterium RIFCSPHIGHO2_12_FULL_43_9]